MRQTELTVDPADGALWDLPGVGTLRRTDRMSRAATAEAAGRSWEIARFGLVRTGFTSTDETGTVVGEVRNRFSGRSDRLRWGGRDLTLRHDGPRRDGHVLLDGDRRIALLTPKQPGKRALDVLIEDPGADPGLLLFAAFVVQACADDASFPQGPSAPTG